MTVRLLAHRQVLWTPSGRLLEGVRYSTTYLRLSCQQLGAKARELLV